MTQKENTTTQERTTDITVSTAIAKTLKKIDALFRSMSNPQARTSFLSHLEFVIRDRMPCPNLSKEPERVGGKHKPE